MGFRRYVGGDPGSSAGHLSVLDSRGRYLADFQLPNREYTSDKKTKKGKFKKTTLTNIHALRKLLISIQGNLSPKDLILGMEFPTPLQGVMGRGNPGLFFSMAALATTAISLGWRLRFIPPKAWLDDTFPHRSGKTDKEKHREAAANSFPELADRLDSTNSDGLADSLLIAMYTRRKCR